jgi:hypothetical protein
MTLNVNLTPCLTTTFDLPIPSPDPRIRPSYGVAMTQHEAGGETERRDSFHSSAIDVSTNPGRHSQETFVLLRSQPSLLTGPTWGHTNRMYAAPTTAAEKKNGTAKRSDPCLSFHGPLPPLIFRQRGTRVPSAYWHFSTTARSPKWLRRKTYSTGQQLWRARTHWTYQHLYLPSAPQSIPTVIQQCVVRQ